MFGVTTIMTFTLCALNSFAEAHMKVNVPSPYGKSSLNNSPLLANGTDFPCKQRLGVYELEGASNVYALGTTNSLRLTGQAVHGGGSCQISITYDSHPTENSIWKVIKSIEGGCPAQNQEGNMGDDANASNPFEYDFTIPSDIPAGTGSIAWTWFNKLGNREMYMNCGPLTMTGTGGDQKNFDALPDMFIANINNGCGVPPGKDVVFPEPGEQVVSLNGATDAFAAPTGSCDSAGSKNSLGTPTPSMTTLASLPIPSTISPLLSSTQTTVPGGSLDSDLLCFAEGSWNCLDSISFQRCAGGRWTPRQQLAAGTFCTPGIHQTLV